MHLRHVNLFGRDRIVVDAVSSAALASLQSRSSSYSCPRRSNGEDDIEHIFDGFDEQWHTGHRHSADTVCVSIDNERFDGCRVSEGQPTRDPCAFRRKKILHEAHVNAL